MRIVLPVSGAKWSAAADYSLRLAKAMCSVTADIQIFTRNKDDVRLPFTNAGFATAGLRLGGAWDFLSPVRLARRLEQCDDSSIVIHVTNFRDAYTAVSARRLYHGQASVAVIVSSVDAAAADTTQSAQRVYGEVDAIIFPSNTLRDTFLSTSPKVDPSRLHVVPDCLGLSQSENENKENSGAVRLIFPGPITPGCGLSYLFDALEQVADLDWALEICGTGRGSIVMPLVRRCREWRQGSRITWAGDCDDLSSRLSAADICVIPVAEPAVIQRQILQAFASGTAVVTQHTQASEEVIQSPSLGILYKKGGAPDLADALRRLITDAAGRDSAAAMAWNLFADRFSPRCAIAAITKIYNEALCR